MSYGLATKIASAQESTTYDFAHVSAAAILTIMSSVFSKPFPLSQMIRLTFLVGGGKATRAKYDDGALAACINGLKGCGYVEDKGAGCVEESGGSYKIQHDTGKNVKTVVVFPRISGAVGGTYKDGEDEADELAEEESDLIPRGSIGYKIAISPMSTFANMLAQHCPTYLQKKRCMRTVSGLLVIESSIENKMMVGQQLNQSEKVFYDSSIELKEKMDHVQKEAARHIDEGNLTGEERKLLTDMNEKKIQNLLKEKNSAKVAQQLKKALSRKDQLSRINTRDESSLPPLRLENQIFALRKKLVPLKALEEASHQRYMSLSETAALSEMDDIQSEVERLESACFGWFEDEDVFEMRVQASRDRFENMIAARSAKRAGGKSATRSTLDSGASGGTTKWILPGEGKAKEKNNAWNWGASKKRSAKGGAVFSAMMMDSSSEEESDDESELVNVNRTSTVPMYIQGQRDNFVVSPSTVPTSKSIGSASCSVADSTITNQWSPKSGSSKLLATTSSKKSLPLPPSDEASEGVEETKAKSKKKKKKRGKSKKSAVVYDDDLSLNDDDESMRNALTRGTVEYSTVSESFGVFVWSLFDLLRAIIMVIVSMPIGLFSGGKNATRKKPRRKMKSG